MGNRKESIKKALGINEYPWSSDDENDNAPSTSPSGSPAAEALPSTPQQSSAQQARMDRDFFWSLINGRNRIPVPRSSSNVEMLLPVPRTRTQPTDTAARVSAGDVRCPAADIQRILAFRRIGSTRTGFRPYRSCSSLFAVPRGAPCPAKFAEPAALLRASIRALDIATPRDTTDYGGADPNPPRRRTPPVPPVRTRIGTQPLTPSRGPRPRPPAPPFCARTSARPPAAPCCAGTSSTGEAAARIHHLPPDGDIEMRAAPSSASAEAGGSQHEDISMLSSIYDDIDIPRPPRTSPAVSINGGGRTAAAPLTVDDIVEVDVAAEATAVAATSSAGTAQCANSAAPEETAGQSSNAGEGSDQPHGIKRKRDDVEETEPSTVQELNMSLLRLLECPVCLEWMEPPMSQCRRGHLVCGRCRARLSSCPVCRTAFSSVRNRAMEGVAEMLRYPCRHGCGREVRLRRRAPHEASCASRRYRCVAPACAHHPPMPHIELTEHLQLKHASMLKVGRKHKFSLKLDCSLNNSWVMVALRELFHVRVDVDIRTWGVAVHVAYIGPKRNANKYFYQVTVLGEDHSRKLVYTRATHCDLENASLNVSRQDCFHLSIDQAHNFLREKNKHCGTDKALRFNVDINKCEEAADVNMEDVDLS